MLVLRVLSDIYNYCNLLFGSLIETKTEFPRLLKEKYPFIMK